MSTAAESGEAEGDVIAGLGFPFGKPEWLWRRRGKPCFCGWISAAMWGVSESTAADAALPECLEEALRSLKAALEKLVAAAERRAKAESLRASLEEELAIMQDGRARLAAERDGAFARVKALEWANDEVRRRLGRAGAEMRAVLAGLEADGGG